MQDPGLPHLQFRLKPKRKGISNADGSEASAKDAGSFTVPPQLQAAKGVKGKRHWSFCQRFRIKDSFTCSTAISLNEKGSQRQEALKLLPEIQEQGCPMYVPPTYTYVPPTYVPVT